MIQFIREHVALWAIILVWVQLAAYFPTFLYVVMPLSVLLMWRNEMWEEMLFGFILCTILSDMDPHIHEMEVMKTAKYTYIVMLGLILFREQARMRPMARTFMIFLPFFVYAFFPIIASPAPVVAFQKTISYGLIFLVMPNLVLFNFRRSGWSFFRNLIWFMVIILVAQQALPYLAPLEWSYIGDRFRGFFGNPNGMALFCYLVFMLMVVVSHVRPELFSTVSKIFIHSVLIYYIITCGARTSLVSTLMFILFIQFFRISVLLGFISFISFIGISEILTNNLPAIIEALGLQEYMRVDTIADGSGRYIAWAYAWELITTKGFFFFGGGFDNEYYLMYAARHYLSALGHQGGVHNTYLALWLNTGIVGLVLFLRSLVLVFIKASKNTSISMAILFSLLFSILYESWLAGSLSPYTTMLLVILTIVSESEIMEADMLVGEELPGQADEPEVAPLILPAR